ncbi:MULTISPECIES: Dam family site-specific DNA-(adenine-N6)-methyltransferase [Bacillales]|uniref:Dam family site-specific DNA-(adenine-N6)-methyltransferase n=1 Tax=Bacillales TaxID=1385 RepID=UPI00054CAEBC|nr:MULTISPECIES: Dam family site-specific DNA-(adenine-N6)-methyltransferase [Bacillales]MCH4458763.1 Dam family site-specific DNA-(adenine-N6)-methyltransferase [Staphylococcus haemolyticus]MEB7435718.1 Dam family site-specific DNA-(adenine-N6)-methyltransferase [Staphylococcus pasteuri]
MRYIGSKATLLDEIKKLLDSKVNGNEKTFLDLFAGTNSVAEFFKKDYKILTNDNLYFSYINSKAVIENNNKLLFNKLTFNPFEFLNDDKNIKLYKKSEYYTKNYTPIGNAMYLTEENGRRVDFIRNTIEDWNEQGYLDHNEYYYLLSSLIESIPYVSNITGTYGAFLKHWDKRALNKLEIKPLPVLNNNKNNKAFNQDSNELVRNVEADITYIDIPYNNRQYASNYHLLENVARHNKPDLNGKTKIFDWSYLKSKYSMKSKAFTSLEDLISNLNTTHIIFSYNDEGIISYEDLVELFKKYSVDNTVEIVKIPYRKYKSKVTSKKIELYEYLFYIQRKDMPLDDNKKNEVNRITTWTPKNKDYIKSPLNYIGGKYKLLNQIIPLFPNKITTFVDLFSGGANVGINVKADRHIFIDMNTKINEMFRYFASEDPEKLLLKIKERIDEFSLSKTNEAGYIKFRNQYNYNPNPLDLYVLISFSYNYQIRFNNNMKYNNPFGKNRSHFSDNMKKNLLNFTNRLRSLDYEFIDDYFQNIDLSSLDSSSLVYLDPPYLITTGSYNDGNRGFQNWGIKQEQEMYRLLKCLTQLGIRYALSNVLCHKNSEHILLKKFIEENNVNVHHLNYSYHNSSYNTSRFTSDEVLITNYDAETYMLL